MGRHPESGRPLTPERRLLFLGGRPPLCAEDWREGPPAERFEELAASVRSRFSRWTRRGDWPVVELVHGQVAGMPEKADAETLYHGLAEGPAAVG